MIIEDPRMLDQFRFPKSKKRRIRKKWAKVPTNFKPSKKVAMFGGVTIAHPQTAAYLRRETQTANHQMNGMRGAQPLFNPGGVGAPVI